MADRIDRERHQSHERTRKAVGMVALVLASLWLATPACYQAKAPHVDANLASAVQTVARDLVHQMGAGEKASRTIVIDPLLDGRTGQQTHASEKAEQQLAAALGAAMRGAKFLPFDGEGASKAGLIVSGTLTAQPAPGLYRLSVAFSDRQSGIVVAQAVAPFREPGLDVSPTRFYRDSPSLVRDRSVEGYVRTAETSAGKPADALYMDQVPTAALIAEALAAYNAEKWDEALKLYDTAVQRKDGQQLRTFNGLYLTHTQLGHASEAEEAFGKIAALGLATNNLAVKLLFRPGSTEFWSDRKVSGVYPMWLHEIARAAQASESCLNIVGHTSKSGSSQVNDRLSLARATVVRDSLEHEAPGIGHKARVSGVGSRENLVGSGADDASDALDRRVEFKVVTCAE